MTILDFLKTDIIIESENDVYIDAEHYDEDELNDWIQNHLLSALDEDDQLFIINYDFKSYEKLKEYLRKEGHYMAVNIVGSALHYRHLPPFEMPYYINNSGSFHVVVKF